MMGPMIGMLCGVSAIIFVVVMYLMLKVMIDRSSFPIALMQIFVADKRNLKTPSEWKLLYWQAIGGIFCMTLGEKRQWIRFIRFLLSMFQPNQSDIWMEIICRRLCSHHTVIFCGSIMCWWVRSGKITGRDFENRE